MDIARGDIALGSFMETFCPAKGPDMALEIFKSIIDTVLAGAMMGSAFLWNKAITPGKFPGLTGDNRGYLKDNFNAGIAYGFNMAKDNQKGYVKYLGCCRRWHNTGRLEANFLSLLGRRT
jgi:hypothetical protein